MTKPRKQTTTKPRKLTAKQKKFGDEYLIDLNQKQAAIRAGYSLRTAESQASRLLVNVKVQEYINKRRKEIEQERGVSPESVIADLQNAVEIALGVKETLVQCSTVDKDGAHTLTSVPVKKTDLNSYLKAVDMIAKHLGFYEQHNKQKQNDNNVVIYELPDNGRD
jgi:phage terminase small subunit